RFETPHCSNCGLSPLARRGRCTWGQSPVGCLQATTTAQVSNSIVRYGTMRAGVAIFSPERATVKLTGLARLRLRVSLHQAFIPLMSQIATRNSVASRSPPRVSLKAETAVKPGTDATEA